MGHHAPVIPGNDGEPLFDPAVIDLVTLSADRMAVLLSIVCDAPWTGSDDQVDSLQMKIHTYVSYALAGGLVAAYPETAGLAWEIHLDCQGATPDDRSAAAINALAEPVSRYGGRLIIHDGREHRAS